MLMFVVANIVGSTIQITTLPLPVLSTLQAVRLIVVPLEASGRELTVSHSLDWFSIPSAPH